MLGYMILHHVGFPIRTSTDLCIFAAPRGFSQLVTSFFGAMYQGIHLNALCSLNFSSSLAYLAIFWVLSFYFHKNSLTLTRLIAFYSSEVFPLFLKLLPFVLTISTFKIAFLYLFLLSMQLSIFDASAKLKPPSSIKTVDLEYLFWG